MRICTAEFMVFMIFALTLVQSQKWSNYNAVNKKNGRSSAYEGESVNGSSDEASTPVKSQQSKPVARGGIGGWGIIAITLTVIFSGVGIYYFVLFYPIVCKKERMYDVMEMTTV